jgi:hypothetical protein
VNSVQHQSKGTCAGGFPGSTDDPAKFLNERLQGGYLERAAAVARTVIFANAASFADLTCREFGVVVRTIPTADAQLVPGRNGGVRDSGGATKMDRRKRETDWCPQTRIIVAVSDR